MIHHRELDLPVFEFALMAMDLPEPDRSEALKRVPWTVLESIRIREALENRSAPKNAANSEDASRAGGNG